MQPSRDAIARAWLVVALIARIGTGRSVKAADSPLDVSGSYALTEGVGDQNDYRVGWLASVGWGVVTRTSVQTSLTAFEREAAIFERPQKSD